MEEIPVKPFFIWFGTNVLPWPNVLKGVSTDGQSFSGSSEHFLFEKHKYK